MARGAWRDAEAAALACLEVAVVCAYVQQDPTLHDQLDRIVATLVKLVGR